MILAHISRSFRETFPGRASEWALAIVILNWSLVLALNTDLFASSASYRALAGVMTQHSWLWLCFCIGTVRLMVLGINGAWRRSPHLRALSAFVSCFVWFQISVGLFQAGTGGTGLAVYPVLLLLDSYNVIRAMGEAGISDASHRGADKDANRA